MDTMEICQFCLATERDYRRLDANERIARKFKLITLHSCKPPTFKYIVKIMNSHCALEIIFFSYQPYKMPVIISAL